MVWLLISLATLVAYGLALFIYHVLQAIVGWSGNAIVEVISIGLGLVLIERKFREVVLRLNLFPWGVRQNLLANLVPIRKTMPCRRTLRMKSGFISFCRIARLTNMNG